MSTSAGSRAKEEKLFVTVRVRPLSNKEQALKDQVAWHCVDDRTIVFKTSSTFYTFDKVFEPSCLTDVVYEKGAKDVALSALKGINATIFAYGQTSSGKTFTMRGITENAINDIYKHIHTTPERDFVIKISAVEIYNEVVHDLLKPESGPLRLLDDPVKGTIVEKLDEVTAKDDQHMRQMIGICEAKRQVGETSLNDNSSRSHQIIKMTVESSLREKSGCVKSFVASLNFVDLAGSERASQTQAEGVRFKEGCHINRSLLTLTNVIRKLSGGKKGGHIPYRDSKLTRILQMSLGGNARTAIICTLSPALSHVDQSRNTLFFATCAKEVTNTTQVNMFVSEKQLVKHLQKEVARLEGERRTPASSSSQALLEKEMKIKKMEIEMEELKRERDLVQLQLEELRQKVHVDHAELSPHRVAKCLTFSGTSCQKGVAQAINQTRNPMRQSSTAPTMLMQEIHKLEQLQEQLGDEANRALEVVHKEVTCHRLGNQDAAETIAKLQAEIREMLTVRSQSKEVVIKEVGGTKKHVANLKEEITRLHSQGGNIANLEEQLENVQESIDKLAMSLPLDFQFNENTPQSSAKVSSKKKLLPLNVSTAVNQPHLIRGPCSTLSSLQKVSESDMENKAPEVDTVADQSLSGSEKPTPTKSEDCGDVSSREGTPRYHRSSSVNMKKMQKMLQNAAEENVRSIKAYVSGLKERFAKLQYQKQLLVCQVLELEANEEATNDASDNDESIVELQKSPTTWHDIFKEQMQQIIQLWDVCSTSIIHRTQFYLLFRGDPADQIYIEVEIRRLFWLQQHFLEGGDASPARGGDDKTISLSSSTKALRQEREFLSKRLNSRLTEEERERLYVRWDVPLEGKHRRIQLVNKLWTDPNDKHRRIQLLNKLWTDPNDKDHIEQSADIVAKLVGFCEGGNVSKEMFELSFALPASKRQWLLGWQPISNLLLRL